LDAKLAAGEENPGATDEETAHAAEQQLLTSKNERAKLHASYAAVYRWLLTGKGVNAECTARGIPVPKFESSFERLTADDRKRVAGHVEDVDATRGDHAAVLRKWGLALLDELAKRDDVTQAEVCRNFEAEPEEWAEEFLPAKMEPEAHVNILAGERP
jgi:hypothetical protein